MGEGDEDVGEDDRGVGVDRRHTMMAPAVFRCHRERGGEMKEICPRGNNKVVIYISLYHDKCIDKT